MGHLRIHDPNRLLRCTHRPLREADQRVLLVLEVQSKYLAQAPCRRARSPGRRSRRLLAPSVPRLPSSHALHVHRKFLSLTIGNRPRCKSWPVQRKHCWRAMKTATELYFCTASARFLYPTFVATGRVNLSNYSCSFHLISIKIPGLIASPRLSTVLAPVQHLRSSAWRITLRSFAHVLARAIAVFREGRWSIRQAKTKRPTFTSDAVTALIGQTRSSIKFSASKHLLYR